ncbi:C-X-C chemokine receptor type 2-like [Osmerus mordax]|uniref:High affinity interleukin-8 receptor B n=1 Tax=Osmerus mordax TaxID=8014 RepID=C1BJX9_OSMMO|nr:High affinity interleukin-8 receptor B [Osmerus mordax]
MADYLEWNYEEYYEPSNNTNLSTYVFNPNTHTCKDHPLFSTVAAAMSITLVGIFLLAVPGNLLVGFVIASRRQTLIPSDVYLLHLTVADGLIAVTLPFWAHNITWGWAFGDFLCKLLSLTTEVNFYTSILFLVCISVDRYFAIVHAADTRNGGWWACSWAVCCVIWTLGGVFALPALFNDAFKPNQSERVVCAEQFDMGNAFHWRVATHGLRHVLGFLLPLAVMLACYGVTLARLVQTRGFQKHRAMRVIVAVVIAFLLCWMPYHLAMIADLLVRAKVVAFDCSVRTSLDLTFVVTHSLALTHCCINPFLYAFVGEKFRSNLGALVKRSWRSDRMSSGSARFSRSTSQMSEGMGQFM